MGASPSAQNSHILLHFSPPSIVGPYSMQCHVLKAMKLILAYLSLTSSKTQEEIDSSIKLFLHLTTESQIWNPHIPHTWNFKIPGLSNQLVFAHVLWTSWSRLLRKGFKPGDEAALYWTRYSDWQQLFSSRGLSHDLSRDPFGLRSWD